MRIREHGHTVIGMTVFFVCLSDGSIAAVAAEQRLTEVKRRDSDEAVEMTADEAVAAAKEI